MVEDTNKKKQKGPCVIWIFKVLKIFINFGFDEIVD